MAWPVAVVLYRLTSGPLEATALLTMSILALTGLVPTQEALSGLSNPSVITTWAVFILSGAVDRTSKLRPFMDYRGLAARGENAPVIGKTKNDLLSRAIFAD